MTIHHNTTYLKFKTARHSTAANAGEILEAYKIAESWKVYNPYDGRRYQATADIIRAIAGEEIEQDDRRLPIEWILAH